MNRKVKNATPYDYDGIHFRSKFEVSLYKHLVQAGYNPEYEPDVITLMEAFRPKAPWYYDGEPMLTKKGDATVVRKKTYTPDFKINVNGTTVYIEGKGSPNDRWGVERKLFLNWIEQNGSDIIFAEIHTIKGLYRLLDNINGRAVEKL